MTFIATDPILGQVDISVVDPTGPAPFNPFNGGTGAGRSSFYMEELRGYDPNLGAGVFTYAQFGAGITAGTVCEFTPTLVSGRIVLTATPWTGTANSGRKLGVAVATGANGQWGWFQVDGPAIVNVSASPTVNAAAYWQANGVVSSTGVASKQACGMVFATASGVTLGSGSGATVLSATQAVALLCRPEAQGAIT
ncbi:MAG: hypothetical protein ACTHOJ_17285 [Sphingomonas oligoaromativorans]